MDGYRVFRHDDCDWPVAKCRKSTTCRSDVRSEHNATAPRRGRMSWYINASRQADRDERLPTISIALPHRALLFRHRCEFQPMIITMDVAEQGIADPQATSVYLPSDPRLKSSLDQKFRPMGNAHDDRCALRD